MRDEQAIHQAAAARRIFRAALDASTVEATFRHSVRCDGSLLRIAEASYDLGLHNELCIIAIGKAGATMFDALAAVLPAALPTTAIVVAPAPPRTTGANLTYFPGGHPEPDANSLVSARAVLKALDQAAPSALVLFLLSGGASAMCELPLSDAITLDDLIQINRLLIGSGAPIAEINCVRKHLSRIKGGRLAVAARNRRKVTLLVSDVPANALDALGSGPTLPDTTTLTDCRRILDRHDLARQLPPIIQASFAETPKPSHPAFANATSHVLLSNDDLIRHASLAAQAEGYEVVVDNTCDDWLYSEAADYLLRTLQQHAAPGRRLCLISGGEITVGLPAHPGVGGRNQQLTLYCATRGIPSGVTVLSAGSDGIDGNSPVAGALADATTNSRAQATGHFLATHLETFNACPLFAALGDAIVTGPTGNNLRDLRLFLYDGN